MTLISRLIRQFSAIGNDKILLEQLDKLVKELRSTNSINLKLEIIKNKPELRRILELIYSPENRFYITSQSLKELQKTEIDKNDHSLYNLLEMLSDRAVTGKAAVSMVKEYINSFPEHEELIKNIIDKNLKVRIGHELIKKSFDTAVDQSISCSLGYPVEKHRDYLRNSMENGDKWFISRKYDGIRTFLVYDHVYKHVKLLTRHMKPITGLNPTISEALKQCLKDLDESVVFDGELVYMCDDKEDFSKTISTIKSLEAKSIDGLQFRAFDLCEKLTLFSNRQEKLEGIFDKYFKNSNIIKLVEQKIMSHFDYDELIEKSIKSGYEGFIIRRDCDLKDGRSRDLLKIKPFQDAEFKVIDYEIGPMRIFDENNVEKTENVLLSITVDFNGKRVNVGSGFSNSERRDFAKYPEKIVEKIVTIRYQSESKVEGRTGNSLRFPVFKVLHGDKRTE